MDDLNPKIKRLIADFLEKEIKEGRLNPNMNIDELIFLYKQDLKGELKNDIQEN